MTQSDNQTPKTNQIQQDNTHIHTEMGVDVLGWVQAANPPDFDLPRKENPRRKLSEAYSVSVTMDQNAFGRFLSLLGAAQFEVVFIPLYICALILSSAQNSCSNLYIQTGC